jgi:hypothetical protein
VLGSSAGELSGTSNFAKERLIRRQGARASAATGKELKGGLELGYEEEGVVRAERQLGKN